MQNLQENQSSTSQIQAEQKKQSEIIAMFDDIA